MARLKGSKNRPKNHQGLTEKVRRFQSCIYRLNVSYLSGYGTFQPLGKDVKRARNISSGLDTLKVRVLDQILRNQSSKDLRYHSIAWQTHQSTGQPHLDILLVYDRNVLRSLSSFNYLLPLCPQRESQTTPGVFITGYSRTRLNKAVLEYGTKEDPQPLSNLPHDLTSFLNVNELRKDPYRYLELQMLKDPLHFSLEEYVRKHDLAYKVKGWSGIKTKLKDMQVAAANLSLKQSPGFKLITRGLIQQRLSSDQLRTYDSWDGYQRIVDKVNQVCLYGYHRPFKSKQLLLVGRSDIGKTTLVRKIQEFTPVYHMDVSNWFPNYRDGVYRLIFWDQFRLKGGMPYTDLLKFLQGSPMDLEYKGGSSLRRDNQLIFMTSNMTLRQHIFLKFKDNQQRKFAMANLPSRIFQLVVPADLNLFILLRLIGVADSSGSSS